MFREIDNWLVLVSSGKKERLVVANYTDMGNSERFVERFGDVVRYVPKWRKWAYFNGVRWIEVEQSYIVEKAKDVVRGHVLRSK